MRYAEGLLAGAVAALLGCADNALPDSGNPGKLPNGSYGSIEADLAHYGTDGGTSGPSGDNVVPIIVDSGPSGSIIPSYNVPFISITLCAPGDPTHCLTIDHVSVDTGSIGLRIVAEALPPSFIAALGVVKDGSGDPLAECYAFAEGYTWGSVKTADLTVGGEKAMALPFQLIGDRSLPSIPAQCKTGGTAENTLADFGAKGLIGVGLYVADCGTDCEDAAQLGSGYPYYGCASATACKQVLLPRAQQIVNPVSLFASDNNGVLIDLPAISAAGAVTAAGSLVFGVGTRANNALGSATVYAAGDAASGGSIDVTFDNHKYTYGFFDSGSSDLFFADSAIKTCTGNLSSYYCPASTLSVTAQNFDGKGVGHDAAFSVANAETLFGNLPDGAAFANLGSASTGDTTIFDWGLPFFFGRRVFVAIEGRSTPGGSGPYYAF